MMRSAPLGIFKPFALTLAPYPWASAGKQFDMGPCCLQKLHGGASMTRQAALPRLQLRVRALQSTACYVCARRACSLLRRPAELRSLKVSSARASHALLAALWLPARAAAYVSCIDTC